MLTPRENLLQIIQGGKPEYLMDQRSYLGAVSTPSSLMPWVSVKSVKR